MSSRAALTRLSLLVGLSSGCALLPSGHLPAYRASVASDAAESSLATFELGSATAAVVDCMYYVDHSKYDSIKLAAGSHRIEVDTTFGVSVMLDARMLIDRNVTATVPMEAGHVYRFVADRRTGQPVLQTFMWIEDTTTGAVVAGERGP